MMSTLQPQASPLGLLGVAREQDEGSLRALCQMCSSSGEATEFKKACVLVTIYRRDSDLFALLLRERKESSGRGGGSGGSGGGGSSSVGGVGVGGNGVVGGGCMIGGGIGGGGGGGKGKGALTVVCDMALDDGVHLEPQGDPLVVKVVNTCGDRSAYMLEFGRSVDLATFQRGFTAARGYFRQMLTLRTLVADSFWQGFASGTGNPARNEPHGSPSIEASPPPGGPGYPDVGLRGKLTGRGAGGADAEELAAEIGLWPCDAVGAGGSSASGSGSASSPRANARAAPSPGVKTSRCKAASASPGSHDPGTGSTPAPAPAYAKLSAPWPALKGPLDRKGNVEHNEGCLDGKMKTCHRCHFDGNERKGNRYSCPDGRKGHVFCVKCIKYAFSVDETELLDGSKRYTCPICDAFCPCRRCEEKRVRARQRELELAESVGGDDAGEDAADADNEEDQKESVHALAQYTPAPQLTHYEGLFTKYVQSLPTLQRLPLTEDVCFLCKEGGNLVECDEGTHWSRRVKAKHASLGKPPPAPGTAYPCCGVPEEEEVGKGGDGAGGEFTQCKKVYHAYCMGFNIASNELGSCPRHACLDCGEAAIFYCRFCPLSLCNEHYATDPSDVIGNTQAALEHRARHPFPRSRIGAPIGGWRKKARGRSRASYKTPPLNRSVKSRGGRSTTPPPGGPPSETIAARRPKRSVAATATPASVVDAARVKKMRLDSAEKSKVVELMAEGRRVRAGWFARREFVCRGCKMATKRAVRQYGLLGSLETDGIVLPFGESEGSDDESESEIYPITPGLPSASPPLSPKHEAEAEPTSPTPSADTTTTTTTTAAAAPAATTTTSAATTAAAAADGIAGAAANGNAADANTDDVMPESAEDGDGLAAKSAGGVEGDADPGCSEEKPQGDVSGSKASCDASGADNGGGGETAQGKDGVVSTGDSGEGGAMAPCGEGKANPDHNPNPGHDRRCSDSSNGSRCNGGGGGGGVTSGGVGVAPGCYRGPAPRAAPVAGIAAAAAAAANNAVAALAAEKYFSMFSRRDPQTAAATGASRSTPPPSAASDAGEEGVSSARATEDSDDNEMQEN